MMRTACLAAATLAAIAVAAPAQACVFTVPIRVTVGETPAEQRAYERGEARAKRAAARAWRVQLGRDVAAGRIDTAAGLADLLIPNVRPAKLGGSDCDGYGDGDSTAGTFETDVAMLFEGSELEGLNADALWTLPITGFLRNSASGLLDACNREVRTRFAATLAQVPRADRDRAYLVLNSQSGERDIRYFVFRDALRRTTPELTMAATPAGKLLADRQNPVVRSLHAFWSETTPRLADGASVCPAAWPHFVAAREALLDGARGRRSYPQLLEQAAKARARAVQTPSGPKS